MRGTRLTTTFSKLQIVWVFFFFSLIALHVILPASVHAQFMFGPPGFSPPTPIPDPATTKVHDAFTYIWATPSPVTPQVIYQMYIDVEEGSEVIFEGSRLVGYTVMIGHHLTIEATALDRPGSTRIVTAGYTSPNCSHAVIAPVRLSDLLPDLFTPAGRYQIVFTYDTTCQNIGFHVGEGYLRINRGHTIPAPPATPTPTITSTPTITPTPTTTLTPTSTPTEMPTFTPTPSASQIGGQATPTASDAASAIPNADSTTPSETPSPSVSMVTDTPTWTPTPQSGASATPVAASATPTATRAPTSTPIYLTPIPFNTASTASNVASPTQTPTVTPIFIGEVLGATTRSVRTCSRTMPVMQSVSTPETYTDYEWGIVRYETQTSSWTEYVPQLLSRWVTRPITQTFACTQYRQEQYQIARSAVVTKEVCSGNWWEIITCSVTRWVSEVVTWVEWATRTVAYTATCFSTTMQNVYEEYWVTSAVTRTSTSQVPVYGWKPVTKTRMKTTQVPTGQTQCVEWVTQQISVTIGPTATPTQAPTSTPTPTPEYASWTRTYTDPVTGTTTQTTYQSHAIEVPYFTQCPVGTFYDGIQPDPPNCYQTCGASSAVMLAAAMGKLSYTSSEDLRSQVFADESIPDSLKSCPNLEGAFAVTAVAPNCNQSSDQNIQKYLNYLGIPTIKSAYSFSNIKSSLQRGKPVIISFFSPGHIVLAKGYTDDGCLIFNDTWEDLTKDPGQRYTANGDGAVYCLNERGNIPNKLSFFYQLTPQ